MSINRSVNTGVEEYINCFPDGTQKILRDIRDTILKAAPTAVESIAYGIPAYKVAERPIAYFAGYEHHIGFYATPNAHSQFVAQLAKYKQGKGSVQFPINQPMPLELIAEMVTFNVAHK